MIFMAKNYMFGSEISIAVPHSSKGDRPHHYSRLRSFDDNVLFKAKNYMFGPDISVAVLHSSKGDPIIIRDFVQPTIMCFLSLRITCLVQILALLFLTHKKVTGPIIFYSRL